MRYQYNSLFAEDICVYIKMKCAMGYSETTYDKLLHQFDQFCCKNFPNEVKLTQEITDRWYCIKEHEHENGLHRRLIALNGFAKYLRLIGKEAYIIPDGMIGKDVPFVPYIYSDNEIRQFFEVADQMPLNLSAKNREYILPVIFRVLFCCGLRPQEVLHLRRKHVEFKNGTIYIEDSKVHKDRIVAMSLELTNLCSKYDYIMQYKYPERKYFFQHPKGIQYSANWLQRQFRRCWRETGRQFPSERHPRVYDWRHNFATRVIMNWLEAGKDVSSMLPYLSEYMGHTELEDTLYYVHLIPERMTFFFVLSIIDVFDRSIIDYYQGYRCTGTDAASLLRRSLIKRNLFNSEYKPVIRTDNGPQFISHAFEDNCAEIGIYHERIPSRTPNKNAHIESFHRIFQDECIGVYEFENYKEAYAEISRFMKRYNNNRLHSSFKYMSPNEFYVLNNGKEIESMAIHL